MNTQQFRYFFRLRSLISTLFALLAVLFLTVGCEEGDEEIIYDAELTPTSGCEPACSSGTTCYEDPTDPTGAPGCFERNCPPDNPMIACAEGAVCQEDGAGGGECVFDLQCSPACRGDTHCAGGNCIPNYSPDNVCDPLVFCRNQCGGANPACLQACEKDRSTACATCQTKLSQCRKRNDGCEPSATGCCAEEYCDCYPGASECTGSTPCATCWNNCEGSTDRIECLGTCAGNSPACATCLQPFIEECSESNAQNSEYCGDLFEQCTGDRY